MIIAFGAITCLLSAFVSNTATVAMLLPTALGILAVIAKLLQDRGLVAVDFDPLRLRVGAAIMLMLAYGASVGGLLTPVGSPPNLIGRGLIEEATGQRISFAAWVGMAVPVCALMFVALAVVLLLLNKPEIKHIDGVEEYVAQQRAEMGPLSRAEKNTLIAFGITVLLWIFPGIVALFVGTESDFYTAVTDRLDEGMVAVFGASLLYLLPVDWQKREFTLRWRDAAGIDWGTIVLFGTGIIFGGLLSSTGLAETIGNGVSSGLGLTSIVAITVFAVLLAILVSETTSNTASAAVVVPIVIPIAVAAGVNPFVPALAATFAASFGFMLPVSTPQNAVVYGSGAVPITTMIRSGFSFDILGAILIIVILPLMVAVMGFGWRWMSGHRIAVIPGDGIGTEVIEAARTVLDAACARHGVTLDYTEFDWSCQRYEREGAMMPADGIETLREFDAILLGAVGWPGVPDHVSLWGLLIPIRRAFRQYVNLRPIRVFEGVQSPLRVADDVDFVVVRENNEGEYSEVGGRVNRGLPGRARGPGVDLHARRGEPDRRLRVRAGGVAARLRHVGHQVERDRAHPAVLGRGGGRARGPAPGRALRQRAHRRARGEVRAAAAAVRRGGRLEPVRRHPVRPRRRRGRLDRHRAVGEPGPDEASSRRCSSRCTARRRTSRAKASPTRSARCGRPR